jgi:Tfp pilus assembly protein PilN
LFGVIASAQAEKHPELELLKSLAAVISDGVDATSLDQFEAWRNVH